MSRRADIYSAMWRDITGTEPDAISKSADITVDAARLRLTLMGAAAERVANRKLARMLRESQKMCAAFERKARENAAYHPMTEPSWSQVSPGYCPPGGAWVAHRSGVTDA